MTGHLPHILLVAFLCLLAWWVHVDQKWRRRGGLGTLGVVRVARIGWRDRAIVKSRPAACILKEARRQPCDCGNPGCKAVKA